MSKKKKKVPLCVNLKHPMQPVGFDGESNLRSQPYGVVRFKANAIVQFLLEAGPFDLNKISMMNFSQEDYTQLMQLIGYSTCGYGDLSTSPRKLVNKADRHGDKIWNEWVTKPNETETG
jgi:hypothetical protein